METVKWIRFFAPAVVISLAAALFPHVVLARDAVDIRFDGVNVTARIEGAALREVTDEIAYVTGIDFQWMVDEGDEPVEIELNGKPLRDAIELLLASRNHATLLSGDGRLLVWVGSVVNTAPPRDLVPETPPESQRSSIGADRRDFSMGTSSPAATAATVGTIEGEDSRSLSGSESSSSLDDGGFEPGFDPAPASAGEFEAAAGSDVLEAGEDGPIDGVPDPSRVQPLPADEPVAGDALMLEDARDRPSQRSLRVRLRALNQISLPSPGSEADPSLQGAAIAVWNPTTKEQSVLLLPAAGWKRTEGEKGYVYTDPRRERGPCEKISIRDSGKIAGRCRGSGLEFSLDEPSQNALAIRLSVGKGAGELRLCAEFGGKVRSDRAAEDGKTGLFYATDAPAPVACPPMPTEEAPTDGSDSSGPSGASIGDGMPGRASGMK